MPNHSSAVSVAESKNATDFLSMPVSGTVGSRDASLSDVSRLSFATLSTSLPNAQRDISQVSCSSSSGLASTNFMEVYSPQHQCKFKLVFKNSIALQRLSVRDVKKHLEKATGLPPPQQCLVDMMALKVIGNDEELTSSLRSGASFRLVPLSQFPHENALEEISRMISGNCSAGIAMDLTSGGMTSSSSTSARESSASTTGRNSDKSSCTIPLPPEEHEGTCASCPLSLEGMTDSTLRGRQFSPPPTKSSGSGEFAHQVRKREDSMHVNNGITASSSPSPRERIKNAIPSHPIEGGGVSSSSVTTPEQIHSLSHSPPCASFHLTLPRGKLASFCDLQGIPHSVGNLRTEENNSASLPSELGTKMKGEHQDIPAHGMNKSGGFLQESKERSVTSLMCPVPNTGSSKLTQEPCTSSRDVLEACLAVSETEKKRLQAYISTLERRCLKAEYEAANATSDWKLEEEIRRLQEVQERMKEEHASYIREMEARWLFKENELIRELDRINEDRRHWLESQRSHEEVHGKQRTMLEVALSFREKELKEKEYQIQHLRGELAALQSRLSPEDEDSDGCEDQVGRRRGRDSSAEGLHDRKHLRILPSSREQTQRCRGSASNISCYPRDEVCFDQLVDEALMAIGAKLHMTDPIVLSEDYSAVLDVNADNVCGSGMHCERASPFCISVGDTSRITILLTVDPLAERLLLYSTLLNYLPSRMDDQHRLYERLLEGAFLGREVGGGTIGMSKENEIVMLSISVDLRRSDPQAMASSLPPFVHAVRTWAQFLLQAFPYRLKDVAWSTPASK